MIVVAEGACERDSELEFSKRRSDGENILGGLGETVANKIGRMTGKDTRSCTLGHLQRGGSPTSRDRVLATRFGVKAVKMIEKAQFGRMVSYQQYHVGSVPIADAVSQLNLVDPEGEIVETARSVGISFGDSADRSFSFIY